MSKRKVAVIVAVLLLATGAGFIMYVRLSIQHLGFLTPSDVKVLTSTAKEAQAAVSLNKNCALPIDDSTVGDRKQEAEMLFVAAMLNLYRAKFSVPARSMSDLERLQDFDKNSTWDMRRLQRDCSVYAYPSDATVIMCGGSRPSTDELDRLVSGASYIQKFYMLGKSEVLYIPAPKC